MSKRKAEKEARKVLRDYSLAIGVSIVVALGIRFFLLEAYRMPSRAMQPAVEPGDTLFVTKSSYGFRVPGAATRISETIPEYGDVAVLEFSDDLGREYIKRVVGLPGDEIEIIQGALFMNGIRRTALPEGESLCALETLPNERSYTVCFEPPVLGIEGKVKVPPEHVFVVGDLRSAPNETRRLKTQGIVPFSLLKGKAQWVWLSIQPPTAGGGGEGFSRIRLNRLFKRIR